MKHILAFLTLITFSQTLLARAVTGEDKKVSFVAVGKPAMLKIRGESTDLNVKFDETKGELSGTAELKLDSLSTGLSLRDSHMKEKYLETKKFPTAILEFKKFKLPHDLKSSVKDQKFTGHLTLHGETHEVSGTYSNNAGKVDANFTLKISDFKIDIPKYMGITVADTVTVDVNFKTKM